MMTVYINDNKFKEGLAIYEQYSSLTDNVSHKLALRACINLNDESKGYKIADKVHMNEDKQLKISLIEFYGHFRDLERAMNVFQSLKAGDMDVPHIGVMMKAFITNRKFQQAMDLYDGHQTLQNDVTDLFAIAACKKLGDYQRGIEIHNKIKTRKYPITMELQNALIEFYGRFKHFDKVKEIFDSMERMNVSTINGMMINLISTKDYQQALDLYDSKNDKLKNNVSHILAIKACTKLEDMERLEQLLLLDKFKDDFKLKMRDEVYVSVINLYRKKGENEKAIDIWRRK